MSILRQRRNDGLRGGLCLNVGGIANGHSGGYEMMMVVVVAAQQTPPLSYGGGCCCRRGGGGGGEGRLWNDWRNLNSKYTTHTHKHTHTL